MLPNNQNIQDLKSNSSQHLCCFICKLLSLPFYGKTGRTIETVLDMLYTLIEDSAVSTKVSTQKQKVKKILAILMSIIQFQRHTCEFNCSLNKNDLTFGVLVTQCWCPHVTQADGALAAAVDKSVTLVGVELRCCYHLGQLLHIGWLNVNNIWRSVVKVKKGKTDICTT